jgi:hypothetical protein
MTDRCRAGDRGENQGILSHPNLGRMNRSNGHLFDGPGLTFWLEDRLATCIEEIKRLPIAELLEQPVDVTAKPFHASYRVEPVVLLREDWNMDEVREGRVLGSGIVTSRTRSGSFKPGYGTTVRVPFAGDSELLLLGIMGGGPPPVGRIGRSEIEFPFEWAADSDPPPIDLLVNRALDAIEHPYLQEQATQIESFNDDLSRQITNALSDRRDRYLQAQRYLSGLQIPVYRRPGAPQTFAAPGVQQRQAPKVDLRQPSQPLQPVLIDEFYQHILSVIAAMARAMERTPGDYSSWDEEKLRDALLVILNTHYTGGATGETFNRSGKVDLLVRIVDRNVFVGECKWWSGPKSFAGADADRPALDQLLSYTTWRDAKLALVMFVGNKELEPAVESARSSLDARKDVSAVRAVGDGELRATVDLPAGGHGDLAVLFVHLRRDVSADDEE